MAAGHWGKQSGEEEGIGCFVSGPPRIDWEGTVREKGIVGRRENGLGGCLSC